jgi:hypothetical protein
VTALVIGLILALPVVLGYALVWHRAKLRHEVTDVAVTLRSRVAGVVPLRWTIPVASIEAVRVNPATRDVRNELIACGFFTWPLAFGTPGGGRVLIRRRGSLFGVILAYTSDAAALSAAVESAMERQRMPRGGSE